MVTSVMEGNKDEAERCVDIALIAAQLGNYERAEKFLRKADALFPTQKSKGSRMRLPWEMTGKLTFK